MRAQIQRTKLFRSLVVERDSTPLHSTPLDSIRIRIEFRFSSLSLFLFPILSVARTLRTPGFSLLVQTRCNYLLLSTRKTPLRSRSRPRFDDTSRVLASLAWFSTQENRGTKRKRDRENKEREGKEKRRKGRMKNERATPGLPTYAYFEV